MPAFERMLFRLSVVCAVLLQAGIATPSTAAVEPEIGKTAPDFTATDSTGRTHRLSDYRGKQVILEWTNHNSVLSSASTTGRVTCKTPRRRQRRTAPSG